MISFTCQLIQLLKRQVNKQINNVFLICVLEESEVMLLSQFSLEKTTQESFFPDCSAKRRRVRSDTCPDVYLGAMGNFTSHINY